MFYRFLRAWRRRREARARKLGYAAYFEHQRRKGFPATQTKFRDKLGYPLNLDAPKTFNEKLVHRRLFGRDPLWTIVSDKVAARDWLVEHDLLHEAQLVPVVGVYGSLAELEAADLPDGVIAKAAWASARHVILRDAARDRPALLRAARDWFAEYPVYGVDKHLYHPHRIPPRIIVERLLSEPGSEMPPNDYKLFTFHGRVAYTQANTELPGGQGQGREFFDRDGAPMAITHKHDRMAEIALPATYPAMIAQAERIGQHFDFARIDFYSVAGTLYMGEITECPTSGYGRFTPPDFDRALGDLWHYDAGAVRTGSETGAAGAG